MSATVVLFSLTIQTEFSECWIDFQCCCQCFCWTTSKFINYWLSHKSEMISWRFSFFCCLFFLHKKDWVWWLMNLSSMLHPMQLLLYLLFRCLVTMSKNDLYVSTSTQFLCFNSPNAVKWVLCWPSVLHRVLVQIFLHSLFLFWGNEWKAKVFEVLSFIIGLTPIVIPNDV